MNTQRSLLYIGKSGCYRGKNNSLILIQNIGRRYLLEPSHPGSPNEHQQSIFGAKIGKLSSLII